MKHQELLRFALIHLEFVAVLQRLPIWAFNIVTVLVAQYLDRYLSEDRLIVLVEHAIISTYSYFIL